MAGASKMRFWTFNIFSLIGVVFFTTVARVSGDALSPVTGGVANFGDRYKIPLTAITVAFVAFSLYSSNKKGTSKVESIDTMERELVAEENKSTDKPAN